jgi:O-antigen/teichoic acid export membrane protein
LNIDILIAHNLLSSEEVGVYFLVSKIFATGFMVFSILIQIYWPTIVNQIIDLEFDSLSVFMKKMFIFFTLSILVCSSVLIIYLLNIDNYDYFDVSDNFNKSTILLVSLFGVYYIIRVVCDLYATLLQCWGETSVLNKVVPIQAIISAALQIIFGYYFGMEGLVLGMLVSFICTVLYALPKEYKRLVKDSLV